MRDLYRRLNIEEQCGDVDDIRLAIDVCPDRKLARTAREILLVPRRRRVYDRYHQLLTTIGHLKEDLAVPKTTAWDSLGCQDFEPDPLASGG